MFEYKVMTEKDSTFGGKFDGESIAKALNEHAAEGWRVVSGFNVANLKTFSGQVIIVLERPTS